MVEEKDGILESAKSYAEIIRKAATPICNTQTETDVDRKTLPNKDYKFYKLVEKLKRLREVGK